MKINNILLYEPRNTKDYYPFSILHPIWEVRVGAFRIFEKYQYLFPESKFHFAGRSDHLASFNARFGFAQKPIEEGNLLVLSSNLYPNSEFLDEIIRNIENRNGASILFRINGQPVGLYLAEKDFPSKKDLFTTDFSLDYVGNSFEPIEKFELEKFKKLDYLYDAIFLNSQAIQDDSRLLRKHKWLLNPNDFPFAHFIKPEEIICGKNVQIQPGCVLDASKGPIIIDDNAEIMAQAVIIGPCYIGKNTLIKIGAKIYHDNSFGEWCKVGGEVENSIIQGYSNKQHEGFLGHSFLCEWVNIGADTNTSDLKNTYANVKIVIEDRDIDTKHLNLGLLCGDHTKTGINSMFTTGTVAGICGILVREWFLPNFIPSFSWGGAKSSPIYKVVNAIETAKIVMKRRGKELTPEEEKLLKFEHERVVAHN